MVVALMYSRLAKKRNTPIYFNINYHTEMKLVPIIMDYCLLQLDTLMFFLRVHLYGRSLPNLIFSTLTPKFFNEIVKFTSQIA